MKSNIPDPPKPHSEYTDCTCETQEQHEALVQSVDESFKRDAERAKMRNERNTYALRMGVIAEQNGHGDSWT